MSIQSFSSSSSKYRGESTTRTRTKTISLLLVLVLNVACGSGIAQTNTVADRVRPVKQARVRLETTFGNIVVQLDAAAAPITVSNFLRYVENHFYDGGSFFRTVTPSNQPNNQVKIEVIQAEADPAREKDSFPPIPLERTRDTNLHHRDGSLSMARDGPDTAQSSFSICVGDQPELDFGGKRNPDGQGFAAFGQVIEGMDVVRKIHDAPANGQRLTPSIRMARAIRLN
jgi:peptidyl-prolyl cis-trans isomerase A (cyclophilin A)